MADMLRIDHINSLPHPLYVRISSGDWWWPVETLCVQTCCMRLDVMGKIQLAHFGDVFEVRDEAGENHDPDTFYSDWKPHD